MGGLSIAHISGLGPANGLSREMQKWYEAKHEVRMRSMLVSNPSVGPRQHCMNFDALTHLSESLMQAQLVSLGRLHEL